MVRRIGVGIGLVVLVVLAAFGSWSIYKRLADPRRRARLAVEDGSAAKALRARLAGQRLCARLLNGREPFPLSGSMLDLPSIEALIAAGLIEPLPEARQPEGGRRPLFRISAKARPFVRSERSGDVELVSLCYGKPVLDQAHLEGDGSLNPAPILRFTYTVGDRPAWVERPDIRAAFPFLNEITATPVRSSARIDFSRAGVGSVIVDPTMDVISAIGGFAYCPPNGYRQAEQCRRK